MADVKEAGTAARTLLRIPVPWVFVLTYLVGAGLETILLRAKFQEYDLLLPIGAALFAAGAALAGWGWLIFHRAGTTRVPGQKSTTFVTWGPYRFTRNPMYVGLALAYLGEAGLQRQLIPVLLLPLTILYLDRVVVPVEEERLVAVFGPEYERYRAKVRRWL